MSPQGYFHEDQYCAACNGGQDLSMGDYQKRVACRYYQSGNCRRGPTCPFAHISITAQVESSTGPHPAYLAGDHVYTYYPLGQTPVYHPLTSPAQPVFLWQPYGPISPSFDPRYGLVCRAENLADFPDDRSDPSSAESSSTAASMDRLRMTLDTTWFEGAESGTLRGVAGLPGDLGTSPSLGYASYSGPVPPGVQTEERVVGDDRGTSGQNFGHSTVAFQSQFLPPWKDDPRKKPLAYKTKPCKFYMANGKCTSGEKCTFIHDPESKGNAKKLPPEPALPPHPELPPKPLNKYDDCRARDYYPITWRVIGGGVMMGGQRQICPAFVAGQCKYGDDCKLAHETELETDLGFIETKNESCRKGEPSPQQPGTKGTTSKRVRPSLPRTAKAEIPLPANFPSTTPRSERPRVPPLKMGTERKKGDEVAVSSAPASPVHRRTRSMSMVTSPSPPDTTHSNYAAEL